MDGVWAGAEGAQAAAGAGYNFDVEGFAPLWAEDDDAAFSTKIALLSLTVAAVVRAGSLAAGPFFCDPGMGFNVVDGGVDGAAAGAAAVGVVAAAAAVDGAAAGAAGEWVWARGWIAGVMVAVPGALNVAKWGYRQSTVELPTASSEEQPELEESEGEGEGAGEQPRRGLSSVSASGLIVGEGEAAGGGGGESAPRESKLEETEETAVATAPRGR